MNKVELSSVGVLCCHRPLLYHPPSRSTKKIVYKETMMDISIGDTKQVIIGIDIFHIVHHF